MKSVLYVLGVVLVLKAMEGAILEGSGRHAPYSRGRRWCAARGAEGVLYVLDG